MYITDNLWATSYQVVLLANDILRSMEDKETILYEGKDIKPMPTASTPPTGDKNRSNEL